MRLPADMTIRVHFADVDAPNAFATLGGHVVVTRGLYAGWRARTRSRWCSPTRSATCCHRDPIAALGGGASLALLLAIAGGDVESLAPQVASLVQRGYSRDAERLADEAALGALERFYGHAGGAADVFRELAAARTLASRTPTLLSTHPTDAERIARLEAAARAGIAPCNRCARSPFRCGPRRRADAVRSFRRRPRAPAVPSGRPGARSQVCAAVAVSRGIWNPAARSPACSLLAIAPLATDARADEYCAPLDKAGVTALFDGWNLSLATLDPDAVSQRYWNDAVLLPTVSNTPRTTPAMVRDYFVHFLEKHPRGRIDSRTVQLGCNLAIDMGTYTFSVMSPSGALGEVAARYTFVYAFRNGEWKIAHHHSSAMPELPGATEAADAHGVKTASGKPAAGRDDGGKGGKAGKGGKGEHGDKPLALDGSRLFLNTDASPDVMEFYPAEARARREAGRVAMRVCADPERRGRRRTESAQELGPRPPGRRGASLGAGGEMGAGDGQPAHRRRLHRGHRRVPSVISRPTSSYWVCM